MTHTEYGVLKEGTQQDESEEKKQLTSKRITRCSVLEEAETDEQNRLDSSICMEILEQAREARVKASHQSARTRTPLIKECVRESRTHAERKEWGAEMYVVEEKENRTRPSSRVLR